MKTSHFAHPEETLGISPDLPATLCGEPWEDWQHPDQGMPLEEALEMLSPYDLAGRKALRDNDQRRRRAGEPVRQCQACFKITRTQ